MEMGFVPGAVVEVLRRAPFGGPIQYRIHGVSISMRNAEASCVSVESVPAEQRVGVRSSRRLELAVQ
jgi:ferrous iron transport protein A